MSECVARLTLTEKDFCQALGLSNDMHVDSCNVSDEVGMIELMVSGPRVPDCPIGSLPGRRSPKWVGGLLVWGFRSEEEVRTFIRGGYDCTDDR